MAGGDDAQDALLSGLLVSTALGDQRAFAELYRLSAPQLNGILRRMTGNSSDAAEARQESFVRMWRYAARFDASRGRAMPWMTAIARNAAIDLLRSHGRPSVPLDEVPDVLEHVTSDPGLSADVKKCLSQLDLTQRRVIIMAIYFGFSHSELAKKLDEPIGTIKSWTRRGIARLKLCLGAAA